MELTQENVEKLNVAKMPDALLCKGLLLDAIEAGDKLEAENERLKTENAELIERAKWNAREQRKHNDKMREENKLLLKIVRHLNYKRCLAMAEWCDAEADVADADGDYDDMRWYQKWHTRWSDLAKKFKE